MRLSNLSLSLTAVYGPTALTISQLLPSGAGRVAAIYSDPAKPSYDECIQKNMEAIAAGRPQDCVLFSDAAGQTPVVYPIGAGQGKGLLLDRSAGLVRGPELVTNGENITSTAGWGSFNGGTLSVSGGSLTVTNGGSGFSGAAGGIGAVTVGKTYAIQIVVSGGTATSRRATIVGVANNTLNLGVNNFILTATSGVVTFFINSATIGETLSISRYSVRELPGHHQRQPTAAARGEFSRRYNQLLATETFESAVWNQSSGATIAANAIAAPNGTGMAVKAIDSATTGEHKVGIRVTKPASAQQYTASVYVKAAERPWFGLYVLQTGVFDNRATCLVDLITGTVKSVASNGTFSYASCTVTDAGNGWFKVELKFTSGAETSLEIREYIGKGASLVYEGDGTSGIYIWGADLRLTADAIPSIPAYQRVTTASDYDEVGFPTYWRAVTDDWAKSHMNPNGATKAYVFWAGQKMSDATAVLLEHSANAGTTSGTVAVVQVSGAGVEGRSGGSNPGMAARVPINTPDRLVFVEDADIAGDRVRAYGNGVLATTNTADQGTGAYTEQDVFFGARAGTSLFANIREYAPPTILFLQPADSLSASHLSKLQRGYAKAVGVTL